MVKQQSKWSVSFEFPDGNIKTYNDSQVFRGLISSGSRPAYAVVTCNISEHNITAKELIDIRYAIFVSIASAMSSGNIRGRVILKPLWLHNLINDRK